MENEANEADEAVSIIKSWGCQMLNQTVLKRLLVCLQIESKSELQFRCELTYIWEMVYTLITFHQAWSVSYSSSVARRWCELFRSCDLFGFLCLIWDISSSTLKETITSTTKHHRTSYPAECRRIPSTLRVQHGFVSFQPFSHCLLRI